MVSDRAFIFHIHIPWGKTLSLVPKSRSSVEVTVKYQGHRFRKRKKKARSGGISVRHIQVVFYSFIQSILFFSAGCLLLPIRDDPGYFQVNTPMAYNRRFPCPPNTLFDPKQCGCGWVDNPVNPSMYLKSLSRSVNKRFIPLTLYYTVPTFNDPDRKEALKTLWKTLWEKEKMLVNSIFSFSHNVFYSSHNKRQYSSHIYFVRIQSVSFFSAMHWFFCFLVADFVRKMGIIQDWPLNHESHLLSKKRSLCLIKRLVINR